MLTDLTIIVILSAKGCPDNSSAIGLGEDSSRSDLMQIEKKEMHIK